MTIAVADEAQRRAAKVVGLTYLFVLLPGIFAEFYVPATIINYDDAAQTALNIVANERLFRLGIAANFVVFAADAILITALFVVLRPVHRGLALLAAFWRLVETSVLMLVILSDLHVVRVLSGAAYLRSFDPEQLAGLARLAISAHNAAYNIGLVLAGLGSTVFCWLWLRSGYVPRALALLGLFSSALMGACTFSFIVFPDLSKTIHVGIYGGPIFLFELAMGLWLATRGLRRADPRD